ncbi:MAG: methylenetetrahydrofolate reductase [NAD(P)H] [Acidimicrobiia bacterium]|nr:MAG: methylenetetrahydrofolate reductase [NAD(P)H] [Acidimicrobiia bacterium]
MTKWWGRGMRPPNDLDAPARAAIRRVLEKPMFELIPLPNALEQAKHLPAGATVSVSASPARGMDATLDLAEDLRRMDFDVVLHLSARLTADRAHLARTLERLDRLHITRVFVIGGDGEESTEFDDALSLLTAMDEISHNLTDIGIACYPEGHAVIPASALGQALLDKQPLASSMTTQMCFLGKTIVDWLADQRKAGVTLPVSLGMPGVADRLRLLRISARIGVGDSIRFLSKNTGVVARFVRPGSYNPGELLEELGSELDDPTYGIAGVHIFTFNSCDSTENWRRRYLEEL